MRTITNVCLKVFLTTLLLSACSKDKPRNAELQAPAPQVIYSAPSSHPDSKAKSGKGAEETPIREGDMTYAEAVEILENSANHSEETIILALERVATSALKEGLFAESLISCAQNSLGLVKMRAACLLLVAEHPERATRLKEVLSSLISTAMDSDDEMLSGAALTALAIHPELSPWNHSELLARLERLIGRHPSLVLSICKKLRLAAPSRTRDVTAANPWESALKSSLNVESASDCAGKQNWWESAACWRNYGALLLMGHPRLPLDRIPRESPGFQQLAKGIPQLAELILKL